MDTLLTYWQEVVSFVIVGITAVIMVRSIIRANTIPKACSHCALVKKESAQFNKR